MNGKDSMSPNKLTEGTLANMRMATVTLPGLLFSPIPSVLLKTIRLDS